MPANAMHEGLDMLTCRIGLFFWRVGAVDILPNKNDDKNRNHFQRRYNN